MSKRLVGALRWPLRGLLDQRAQGSPLRWLKQNSKNTRGMFACPPHQLSASPGAGWGGGGRFSFSWEPWEWADVKFLEERGYFGWRSTFKVALDSGSTPIQALQGVVGLVLLILRGRAENLSDSVYLCDRLDTGF